MTYDMGNTDKLNVFRQELQRLGIALLPPDINRSEADFGVEVAREDSGDGTPAIRSALAALKNFGANAMAALVAVREAKGPFQSPPDLANRLEAKLSNKPPVHNPPRDAAFHSLCPNHHNGFPSPQTTV